MQLRRHRRHQLVAALAAVPAPLLFAACGGLTAGGARDTLPPLPPPGAGVAITQVTVPPTQPPSGSTLAPGETVPSDDANPLSVASRFLDAARTGNSAVGAALDAGVAQPRAFDWAVDRYRSTVEVAGEDAWGGPQCTEPAGATVTCTWLANDPATSLQLVQSGDTWRVSHPVQLRPDAGSPAGTACVAGDDRVNVRGGPGTDWPLFTAVQPSTCGIAIHEGVTEGPSGPWRFVTIDGTPGWIVDRVLNVQ
jgi:hypothetical protein